MFLYLLFSLIYFNTFIQKYIFGSFIIKAVCDANKFVIVINGLIINV